MWGFSSVAGLGEGIDEGDEGVANEDGKGDAVGEVAEVTDGDGKCADEDAVEPAAQRGGGGSHGVGSDEAGAEDDGAAAELGVGVEGGGAAQPEGECADGCADEG